MLTVICASEIGGWGERELWAFNSLEKAQQQIFEILLNIYHVLMAVKHCSSLSNLQIIAAY